MTFTEPLFSRRLVSWQQTSLWHHFLVFHLQCNCIDILRVQDINWWQQGLYPGECRVSLLELGSSGVHAVSIAIKCEDNKIINFISCILVSQTLYQTRLLRWWRAHQLLNCPAWTPQEKKSCFCTQLNSLICYSAIRFLLWSNRQMRCIIILGEFHVCR